MKIRFWGTRGSLPTATAGDLIEKKIFQALKASRSQNLDDDAAIRAFIGKLPFAVRQSYGGNTACVEIQGGQPEYVLCDAGTGLRDFGNSFMKTAYGTLAPSSTVFHLFISHLHWDHIQGFPFFTPAYVPGHQVRIYGYHPALEKAFVNQQSPPSFPVPLKAMKADISFHVLEPGRACEVAGLKVTGISQNHPGDSYGYCFSGNGKKVIYSSDAEHKADAESEDYAFIGFFKDADLLIFDAQYQLRDAIDAKENWGHSSNVLGVELSVRAGVRRLCLFHSEHSYDDDALDQFLADTREYLKIYDASSPLEIQLAYDGLVMEI